MSECDHGDVCMIFYIGRGGEEQIATWCAECGAFRSKESGLWVKPKPTIANANLDPSTLEARVAELEAALNGIMPFVLEDYHPACATREFGNAVIAAMQANRKTVKKWDGK